MSTLLTKPWHILRHELIEVVSELQTRRDYEEEVSLDPEFADMLTNAIDALMPLLPLVVNQ
jgi:hypothetical protein